MELEKLYHDGKKIIDDAHYGQAKQDFSDWCVQVRKTAAAFGLTTDQIQSLNVKMHFIENEYSPIDSKRNLNRAVEETINNLKLLEDSQGQVISENTALCVVRRILSNFYMHIKAMYQDDVHKRGTLQMDALEAIKIGNEYDVQRVIRALLLPVFPETRAEVNSDNGTGGMRADLYLDEYDLAIEIKCTRSSMTQKQLTEELGADGFLYPHRNIFMFVYDKEGIISNVPSFVNTFKRKNELRGKSVEAFVVQPVKL